MTTHSKGKYVAFRSHRNSLTTKESIWRARVTHTSPPAPEQCEEQDACRIPAMCPEVTLAAKAEREQVLDDVAQFVQKGTWTTYPVKVGVVSTAPLMRFLQSLRAHQQQRGVSE